MANLLFSSGFEGGVGLTGPYNVSSSNAWQDVTGTDAVTGQTWPGNLWGGDSAIQMLNMSGTLSSVITNGIETVTGRDGTPTRALHLDVNQKAHEWTQSPLLFQPGREPGDFYIRQSVKLPDNLGQTLGSGGWFAAFGEWKSAGDFRVVTNIVVDNAGTPYWHMKWDSNANGSAPLQTFWTGENRTIPVPQGEWAEVEFFTHRGNTDGRVWLKVNGQTVFDHTGDNIGIYNAPIDRIFLGNPYANTPIDLYIDNIQIWDAVPTGGSTPPTPPAPPTEPALPPPSTSTPGTTPAAITVGSGSDTLLLKISQDAFNGGAQYTVSVDGKQVGGTLTAKALHSLGQSDVVGVKGDWGAGPHSVSVTFLNDSYGGSGKDRNLYVDGATYNGADVSGAKLSLLSNGSKSFSVTDSTAVPGTPAAPPPGNGTTTIGTASADTLTGLAGNDTIKGGAGNDTINGAGGNDWIEGGLGHEKLTGGSGADTFAFKLGDGWDWISDFARGTDKLRMIGMDEPDLSWSRKTWPGVGDGLEVAYNGGAGGGVFLLNVTSLAWSDFVL